MRAGFLRCRQMKKNAERRREQRLRYHWPIWFAEDFGKTLFQGQMLDVSSTSASFTCHIDANSPRFGQQISTHFSIPRLGSDDLLDTVSLTRIGHIRRIEQIDNCLQCIAVSFAEPLSFRPGEQTNSDSQEQVFEAIAQ